MDAAAGVVGGAALGALLAWFAWLIQRLVTRSGIRGLLRWHLEWDLEELVAIERDLEKGNATHGDSLLHRVWHATMISYVEHGGPLRRLRVTADYARRTLGLSLAMAAFSESVRQRPEADLGHEYDRRAGLESRRQAMLVMLHKVREHNASAGRELNSRIFPTR